MAIETFSEQADTFIKGLSLTNFDIIIFSIIGISTLIALFRGFVKSFVSSVGWIISLIIALYFYDTLSPIFVKYTVSKSMADLLSFGVLFLASAIVIAIINSIIITLASNSCGGILDRSFGLFFGLVRGCILVSAGFYVMVLLIPELNVKDRYDVMHNDKLPKWARKSESLLLLSKGSSFIEGIVPEHFQDNLKHSFAEQQKSDPEKREESVNTDSTTVTDNYSTIKKTQPTVDRSSNIKAMNRLLSSLPQEVIEETSQEDLFVLQDSIADPAIKVQILEKLANNYQKYTNDITYGASANAIKAQNRKYRRVYSIIEKEISRYNNMVNSNTIVD